MKRYLSTLLPPILDKKIVLIAGPRQSGKTTLAKSLFGKTEYLNYDDELHREKIIKRHWLRDAECVIFDELHKMKEWKRWIKGIYDTEGISPRLLVTGSAHMEAFSHVGDSLAGRYFQFRLYPLDVKEAVTYWKNDPQEAIERLLMFGGFPEPFLEGSIDFYKVWQKTHLDIILRQDFLDLYSVRSLKNIEILLQLLLPRVASTVSFSNLSRDLQVDHNSVKSWLASLESIYALFRITPYHKNIARSLLKEPKFYFYDVGRVREFGPRLENLVAICLIKELHYLEDTKGLSCSLHFLRTKDGHEIDFLIVIDDCPILCIEVKTSDDTVSKSFALFRKYIPSVKMIQLVYDMKHDYDTPAGVQVRRLAPFLAELDLLRYVNATE
jgi:uncharacterized protein